jgi:hypothetical protein
MSWIVEHVIRRYFCSRCWMQRQITTTRPGHWKLSPLFSHSGRYSTMQNKKNTHSRNWIHDHIAYSRYHWPPSSISPKLRLRTQSGGIFEFQPDKWQFLWPPSGYLHLSDKVEATFIAKPLVASFMKTSHSLVSVTSALVSVEEQNTALW